MFTKKFQSNITAGLKDEGEKVSVAMGAALIC